MDENWQARIDAVWDSADTLGETEVVRRIDELVAERGKLDAEGAFEAAGARDSAGMEREAEGLYRFALDAGLTEPKRARAVIQLASTLRNLGRTDEAIRMLRAHFDDDPQHPLFSASRAFLALCYASRGETDTSTAIALEALAAHLPRYQRSVRAYAGEVGKAQRPKQQVRVMNDYAVKLPLWGPDSLRDPKSWPLSDGLLERLRAWAVGFYEHFDHEYGWDDPPRASGHAAAGRTLRDEVADELGDRYNVTLRPLVPLPSQMQEWAETRPAFVWRAIPWERSTPAFGTAHVGRSAGEG